MKITCYTLVLVFPLPSMPIHTHVCHLALRHPNHSTKFVESVGKIKVHVSVGTLLWQPRLGHRHHVHHPLLPHDALEVVLLRLAVPQVEQHLGDHLGLCLPVLRLDGVLVVDTDKAAGWQLGDLCVGEDINQTMRGEGSMRLL